MSAHQLNTEHRPCTSRLRKSAVASATLLVLVGGCRDTLPTATATRRVMPAMASSVVASKIAFATNRGGGNLEIYTMNSDGSGLTRLTNNSAHDWWPAWSPDGAKIAFTTQRNGNDDIYVMNADGSAQTRLTTSQADDSRPAWSPDGAKIAFKSTRDGNTEIYVMNADGSGQTRLTTDPSIDFEPSWSPDGSKIAFVSNRDGDNEIYVMNPDGSGPTQITDNANDDLEPAWSPDGLKIAFASNRHGGLHAIYIMNADGSAPVRVTNANLFDERPSWSSDGTQLAFQRDPGGAGSNSEIFVMNADGSGQMNITNNPAFDAYAAWQWIPVVQSQSKAIAFATNRDGGSLEIYTMNSDGSGLTRLTNNSAHDWWPAWSPDGAKIAFTTQRNGNDDIYVMNADGSAQTRLTTSQADDSRPAWSPDGAKIAFKSTRDGNTEIYVMNADGSGQTRLTTDPSIDFEPSWSPDGSKIAFVSNRDGDNEIYVMNPDGSGPTQITDNANDDLEPAWSPDGLKIAFASNRHGGLHAIYIMNADGSAPVRVTNANLFDERPSWSSDGTQLAFQRDPGGAGSNSEIFVMNADGSGQMNITNNPAFDAYAAWQWIPVVQSQTLAFTSSAPSNAVYNGATYSMSATATSGLQVTFGTTAPSVCAVVGSITSFVGVGTCSVTADQGGNAGFSAAPQVTQTFSVDKAVQTIVFTSVPPSPAYVGTAYSASAAGGASGNPIVFGSLTPAVCSVTGVAVALDAVGGCIIAADQAGDANYAAAPRVTQTFHSADGTAPTASPTLTAGSNPPPAWNTRDVIVTWGWVDEAGGSGIDPASCNVSSTSSGEGTAVTLNATCNDLAGNTGSASFVVRVDKTGPTLNPVVSPNPVILNGAATVTSGAADALSGLVSQGCGALVTNSVGTKSVTCTATDQAGNVTNAAGSYAVNYGFAGFFQPVDNLPTVNVSKAGSAIPVKFSLAGNQGLGIMAPGYPVSALTTCGNTATDDIEQTVTAGASSLSYDALSGQYTYVWKTDKLWVNTCRTLTLKFIDNTTRQANFRFK